MKINIVGNILNFAFLQARELRKRGFDAYAFIEGNSSTHYHPSFVDPEFSFEKYPYVFEFNLGYKKILFNDDFVKKVSDCDLIHTTGASLPWLWRVKCPILFTSMGADINSVPFYSNPMGEFQLRRHIRTFLMRLGLKKPEIIEILPFQLPKSRMLGLHNISFIHGLFTDILDDYYDRKFYSYIKTIADQNNYLFIHLSRHYWGIPNRIGKGNDVFIRSLDILNTKSKVKVLMIDKGPSVDKSKKLINEMGLEKFIIWLPVMNRPKLRAIYKLKNSVFFDNFDCGVSDLGYVGRETLSTGNILVCNSTIENGGDPFFRPPVFSVHGKSQEIRTSIKKILNMNRSEYKQYRNNVKLWAGKYLSNDSIFNHYYSLYNDILTNQ